ncbi:GMC family oxidoreductase [Streptomyces montanisoli]|uniref:GMC family oxidoreductase N-terminal domain-containing protein n=1 Tax=Streptomyces montanisoli TaxID=2798581 RepID=A0A940MDQ7_9ACTN|nr:GMC family oxidoreductase N-terminal domain-containing protein [Streptomyces montanisoli]MBP0458105.1 GMC family oxidoreductase N-terminal domain-containing protein [Streptomyces montanisoli]
MPEQQNQQQEQEQDGAPETYEYIVVGAGTAGCVLARRLSEDRTHRVLLLEAGRPVPAEPDPVPAPAAWPSLLGTAADWGDTTVPQNTGGAPIPWPRGRGLGGSSAIGGMTFLRGHRSGCDAWPEGGAKGWGYDDLLPYFKRSENVTGVRRRDPASRGTDGPLRVAPAARRHRHPLAQAFLAAAVQAGHPRACDLAAGLETGFGWADLAIADGARQDAAGAYLRPVLGERTNMRVITDAFVQRLLLDETGTSPRCTGVAYTVADGTPPEDTPAEDTSAEDSPQHAAPSRTARCSPGGEVVLTAGAVGSPRLLMSSGLGPREHLEDIGITAHLDLPGVGGNLQDHVVSGVVYRSARPVPESENNHAEVQGLIRSDPHATTCTAPDLQLGIADLPVRAGGLPGPGPGAGYTIVVALLSPYSRGTVRLADADPATPPSIDPCYYADHHDLDLMTAGLRAAREIGMAPALTLWRGEEELPGRDIADDEELRAYLRRNLHSAHDYAGTCAIGTDTDAGAVVDTELRVRGVEGLRVADASVMPTIVSANAEATVYAIAERASDLLTH